MVVRSTENARPEPDAERRRLLRFLRKLPHDFANAILPFRIAGDLLRRADGDPEVVDQVVRILDDQSSQAQRLIDDLERTVRVVLGEIAMRSRACDLAEVVASGVAAARLHAPTSAEIEVMKPSESITIEADPTQLSAAIEELVDNAARFGGEGTILVDMERAGDAALVRVRDGGPGVVGNRLDQIFEPFVAGDTVDSGWGIGLGFVRLVAAGHGGSVTATPGTDGRGLVMTLRLPVPR